MTLVPTAYLGSISYYRTLLSANQLCINKEQIYDKKLHLNRCRIMAANGILTLTVPCIHPPTGTPVRDVRIDNHEAWQHQHWISIRSAYKTSPFFDYLIDDIEPFYTRRYDFLIDINEDLRLWTLKALNVTTGVPVNSGFKPYYQVFAARHGFATDLSILDLICNLGPEAGEYL